MEDERGIGGSRIIAIETVRTRRQNNVLWIRLIAEDGTSGLGETFYGATVVEEYLHSHAAPLLFGAPDGSPAVLARALGNYVGYSGSGAEVRGNSAIDIAAWDLLARRLDTPLNRLLGGPSVPSIRTYNTCAGPNYVSDTSRQSSTNWGMSPGGRHEDLWRFMHDPGGLAIELRDEGFLGMKVWPFDLAAEESRGDHTADLSAGLRVLDAIRSAVGSDLELYVELHSAWQMRGARRLLAELEAFDLTWVEDPLRADFADALGVLRSETSIPFAVGENLGASLGDFTKLLRSRGVDVGILDLGWSGGVSQALKFAALAEEALLPVAPHDCTGPVSLAVATHFVTAIPNGMVQEVARSFYFDWYQWACTGLPSLEAGHICPGKRAGHGVELSSEMLSDGATIVRRSEAP